MFASQEQSLLGLAEAKGIWTILGSTVGLRRRNDAKTKRDMPVSYCNTTTSEAEKVMERRSPSRQVYLATTVFNDQLARGKRRGRENIWLRRTQLYVPVPIWVNVLILSIPHAPQSRSSQSKRTKHLHRPLIYGSQADWAETELRSFSLLPICFFAGFPSYPTQLSLLLKTSDQQLERRKQLRTQRLQQASAVAYAAQSACDADDFSR